MPLAEAKKLSHPDRPNDRRFAVTCSDDNPGDFDDPFRLLIPAIEITVCMFKAPGEKFPWDGAKPVFGSARGELFMRFVKVSETHSQLYELHWHSEQADLKELWEQLERRYGPANQSEHNMKVWTQGETTLTVTENFGRGAIVNLSNNRLVGIAAEHERRPRL